MNATARQSIRAAVASLAAGAMTLALAASAIATHVVVSPMFPAAATVGQIVPLVIDMRSGDGAPLPGTTVVFYLHMSFAGVAGEAEIGRAVTDEAGVATLNYQPRAAGHHELRMEYMAPGDSAVEEVTASFEVAGGEQLVRSAGGPDIPGINSGMLMVILGTVWLILLGVAFLLLGIARAGREGVPPGSEKER